MRIFPKNQPGYSSSGRNLFLPLFVLWIFGQLIGSFIHRIAVHGLTP